MIEKFTARPAEEILLDLYALKLRERDGEKMEPPVLTLLLGGNRTPVNGFLIDMKKEVNSKQVVIQLQNTNDVLFIDMYAVAGIVLHDADRIVPFLVDLAPDDTSKMLPVTRLDVKKQQAEVTTNLNLHFKGIALLFNEELPAVASELYFVRQFLTDISMALITLGKTTIGKQIIQNEIKTVQITRGTPLQIKRDLDGIVVQYPFNKMYTTNIERHFLTDRLSEIL